MKIDTKRILAVIICCLMLSEVCLAFEKKHRSSRFFSRFRSYVSYEQTQLKLRNKWAKLAEGVMVGITGGDTAWVKCLPSKWTQEVEEPQEQTYLEGKFSGMSSAGQSILKFMGMIVDGFCKIKSAIMRVFEIIFTGGNRKFFLEGRFGSGSMSTKGFFKRLIKKAKSVANKVVKGVKKAATTVAQGVKKAATTVAQGVKKGATTVAQGVKKAATTVAQGVKKVGQGIVTAAKWVTDRVKQAWAAISAFAQGLIVKIKDFIVRIKNSIFGFFKSETFKTIVKIITCIPTLKDAAMALKGVIVGIKQKLTAIMSGVFAVPAIVKFIIELICRKNDFIAAINDFGAAASNADVLQKFYLRGRGIGRILEIFATSKRRF